jgi:serine/threonine-protein kinase RsbW
VPATPVAIAAIADRVTRLLAERQWPQDGVDAVELALREALANAIRHGCRGDVTQYVCCSFAYEEGDAVMLIVRDSGSGFDPAGVPDPLDLANRLNHGGRGILLMRELMDDVQFGDGGREVRMRKQKGSR